MIESRELISATRQLGSMTEAGVDILRAIKVLRAQTQDVELLALYDRLAQEMRLGSSVAEAMSHAPEVFSEFVVSIVRQGEARSDLATSFYRIADYLQKERETDSPFSEIVSPTNAHKANLELESCPLWLRRVIYKTLVTLCVLFVFLFLVEILVALSFIAARWHLACSIFTVTAFLLCMAAYLRHTNQAEAKKPSMPKSTFQEDSKSTFDKTSEATFE